MAPKRVFAKDTGEVEGIATRVVIGQIILVTVGRVHVESARLQCLNPRTIKQTMAALKCHTSINAKGGCRHTGGGLSLVSIVKQGVG